MSEVNTDWWLSEEANLQQPKLEVGNYVESMDFLVPRRFDNLEAAMAHVNTGGRIVIRSESPDEYAGASGLLESYRVDQAEIASGQRTHKEDFPDVEPLEEAIYKTNCALSRPSQGEHPGSWQVLSMIIGDIPNVEPDVTMRRLHAYQMVNSSARRYAELTRQPTFRDDVTFSFWEYVDGANTTIVADDVIDNQYHIFMRPDYKKDAMARRTAVITNEAGEPRRGIISSHSRPSSELMHSVIRHYEAIRNLPRFANQNCPIMEMQIDNQGQIWFLQYHRSRDFNLSTERLNPDDFRQTEGWLKASGVRGALDGPTSLQTALWYPDNYGGTQPGSLTLPDHEEGSFDWGLDQALSEVLSRRRTAFFTYKDLNDFYDNLSIGHKERSTWFKPQVGISLYERDYDLMVPDGLKELVFNSRRLGKISRMLLDVASDGLDGYVRLNPTSEQPVLTDN